MTPEIRWHMEAIERDAEAHFQRFIATAPRLLRLGRTPWRCKLCGHANVERFPKIRGRKRFQWPLLFWYLTREVPSIYGGGLCRMCSKATQAGAKALYEKIEADILAEYGAVSQEEK